jgi:hypothetical protein
MPVAVDRQKWAKTEGDSPGSERFATHVSVGDLVGFTFVKVRFGERLRISAYGPDRVKTRRESGVGNTSQYKRDRGSGEFRNGTWHGRHEMPEALFRPSLPSSMHRYPIFS